MGLGLALVMVATPAVADIGQPAVAPRPAVAAVSSYRYFEPRGDAQTPGAYWNPCRTITYGIDFRAAGKRGLNAQWERERWASVMREVSRASGLTFRYVGAIKTRSMGRRPAAVRGVDVPVVYGVPRAYRRALKGPIAGVAGVDWHRTSMTGRKRIHSGYVVIDAAEIVRRTSSWNGPVDNRPATQRTPDTLRALYLHEFGHALGMEHVHDRGQIMYPKLSVSRPDVLGAGDRAGLAKLGRQRCFS